MNIVKTTSKDPNFAKVGFGNVCDLKVIVIDILDGYKNHWKRYGVADWDYDLIEGEKQEGLTYEVTIEIWAGRGIFNPCIFRISTSALTTDFAEKNRTQEVCWKRMIREIGWFGIDTIIENHTEFIRNIEESSNVYSPRPFSHD